MNNYFETLFSDFNEAEHEMLGAMIFRIGNNRLSFNSWIDTMSGEEKAFADNLTNRVNSEYFCSVATNETESLYLFSEIMIYYITHSEELGWALPAVGVLYGEAMQKW